MQSSLHEIVNDEYYCLRRILAACIAATLAMVTGCNDKPPAVQVFEPNYVRAYVHQIQDDFSAVPLEGQAMAPMAQALADTQALLTTWFGTPDEPKLPELFNEGDYKGLVSIEGLKMAAGAPEGIEPGDRGLYRQLCVSCHGVTGQGRGTLAASQNPFPRDFRMGLFKFKSTPRNAKPLRADLERILRHGLAGSQMPIFNKLSPKQIDALLDYVIYLSTRGELERQMLSTAAALPDIDTGQRVYDPSNTEKLKGQLEEINRNLKRILDSWVDAAKKIEEFTPPEDIPVPGFSSEIDAARLTASVARGKEIFLSETGACSKCHGDLGRGDGKQVPSFDDWTKDWISIAKPNDRLSLLPLLARGALNPQPLPPRNLAEGKFRGGGDAIDIYRRIRYGIAGSPMPAASVTSDPNVPGVKEEELWHIVNFVRSLSGNQLTANEFPAVKVN